MPSATLIGGTLYIMNKPQSNRHIPLAKKYDDAILREEVKAREKIMREQLLSKDQEPEEEQQLQWTELPFGKHKGWTLPEIAEEDPGYIDWLHQKGFLKGRLREELEMVYRSRR